MRAAAIIASRITPLMDAANEDRLIRERLNLELGRKCLRNARQNLADTLDHVDRRSVPGLEYGHQYAAIVRPGERCWSAARIRR